MVIPRVSFQSGGQSLSSPGTGDDRGRDSGSSCGSGSSCDSGSSCGSGSGSSWTADSTSFSPPAATTQAPAETVDDEAAARGPAAAADAALR